MLARVREELSSIDFYLLQGGSLQNKRPIFLWYGGILLNMFPLFVESSCIAG